MTILLKPTVTTGDSSNIQKDVETSMVSFDNDLQMVGCPSFCMSSGYFRRVSSFFFPAISSVLSLALELYSISEGSLSSRHEAQAEVFNVAVGALERPGRGSECLSLIWPFNRDNYHQHS